MENLSDTNEYLKRQFGLDGKVALITGGNGGLGLAIAKGLGKAGAKVVIIGRNEEKNSRAHGELLEDAINAMAIRADVTQISDVRQVVAMTIDKFGALDLLVN